MDPTTVAQRPGAPKAKPSRWWTLITVAVGATGALGAIGVAGSGTYDVAPFKVELQALPAPAGKTVLAKRAAGIEPGRAEAGTHNSPVELRATIVGISGGGITSTDDLAIAEPSGFATFMGSEGKEAVRAFAIKLALLAAAGGAAGGLAISLGRWRRILGGAVGGILAIAVIGVLVAQTYDTEEFKKTTFTSDGPAQPGELIPTVIPPT